MNANIINTQILIKLSLTSNFSEGQRSHKAKFIFQIKFFLGYLLFMIKLYDYEVIEGHIRSFVLKSTFS